MLRNVKKYDDMIVEEFINAYPYVKVDGTGGGRVKVGGVDYSLSHHTHGK